MPLIPKPNYNQIFASQAPAQDKPAVFNNYPEGWGVESRPNNGKPTIKGFNYLQQTSDLKDLWILQNGAALPYDAAMEYAENAHVVKDGELQQWKDGGWLPVTNKGGAVKVLRAAEIGLVKWTEFKKPPYTLQEYEQAYNNGINLVAAVKKANDDGYSKVVLERGNYPMCYSRLNNVSTIDRNRLGHAVIDGTTGMTLDLNSSTLFVIFDSNNRSPYDSATTSQPYQLPGSVLAIRNTENFTICNGYFRGDQFMRTWVSGERNTEQTYGYYVGTNNVNFKVDDCVFFGFRGDGVCGTNTGTPITGTDLTTWYKGGLDATGNEIPQEGGTYRTLKMDIRAGTPILRNSIQFQTLGNLQAANFRNDNLDIYFFDQAGAFISKETVRQTENIVLPEGCRYVQVVAYEDERTDATVTYGIYLFMATGSTLNGSLERCEFYANQRGGVANLCRTLVVDDCDFHDIGTTKYGFPTYGSTTRYCINFEDTYNELLTVRNTRMKNSGSAILSNARNVQVSGGYIKDMLYSSFALAATTTSIVTGVLIDNVGRLVSLTPITTTQKRERSVTISNCTIRHTNCYSYIHAESGYFLDISNNFFFRCLISYAGDGRNLNFNGNTIKGFLKTATGYPNWYFISGALSHNNNNILTTDYLANGTGRGIFGAYGNTSHNNQIIIGYPEELRLTRPSANDPHIRFKGITFESNGNNLLMYSTPRSPAWDSEHKDKYTLEDVVLDNTNIHLGETTDRGPLSDNVTVFNNLTLKRGAHLTLARNEPSAATKSTMTIVIKDSHIDLTDIPYLLRVRNSLTSPVHLILQECSFSSDIAQTLDLLNGDKANLTATAINCTFYNITLTGTTLQIQGVVTATYDPPSLENGVQQSTTVALTGAKLGDNINVSFDKTLGGTRMWGEVTSANTVTVYHRNDTGAVVDVPSGTLTVKIV